MTDTNLGPLYAVASTIEGIVLDVDGVLTDGKITYTSDGNELKSFHVQDGGSLKLLASHGIALAIITGRQSTIVERRAKEALPLYNRVLTTKPQPSISLLVTAFPLLVYARLAMTCRTCSCSTMAGYPSPRP